MYIDIKCSDSHYQQFSLCLCVQTDSQAQPEAKRVVLK